jgi:hypothetical protein
LPPVANLLIEDAEFITDTVADCWNLESRKRFQVAGGKSAKTTIAEAGFLFLV